MMNFTYFKKGACLFLFSLGFFSVNAQENERYTQYLYNPMSINPAFAGSRGVTSVFSSYRTQWVGVPGAPKTLMFSVNGIAKNENVGFGLSIVKDEIGPSDQAGIAVDFSYSLKMNANYKLSFGLKASANLLNIDFNKLEKDPDVVFQDNIDNEFSPNIGVGLYLHSDKTSIGIAVPNLLETKFYNRYVSNASNSKIAKENLHVFLTADHLFELNSVVKFKPALLVKILKEGSLQTFVSTNFLIQDKFTLGMSYRFGGTISNLAGFQVSDRMFIGYGYDLETKKMPTYNTGSHEIFVRFDLFSKGDKKKISNFF